MRVVQFSTGLASAEVARREVERHGPAGPTLVSDRSTLSVILPFAPGTRVRVVAASEEEP